MTAELYHQADEGLPDIREPFFMLDPGALTRA
jgi:hypothetical protein